MKAQVKETILLDEYVQDRYHNASVITNMMNLRGKIIEVTEQENNHWWEGEKYTWHKNWLEFLPEEKKGKALKDINVKYVNVPVCKLHWQLLPENKITICTLTLNLATLPHWKFKGIARCSEQDTWDDYEGMKWSMIDAIKCAFINKNTRYARLECYRAFVRAVKADKKKKGKINGEN